MFLDAPALPPDAADADRTTAVESLPGAWTQVAQGAFSANTERAVKADLGSYTAWCAERARAALPAMADHADPPRSRRTLQQSRTMSPKHRVVC